MCTIDDYIKINILNAYYIYLFMYIQSNTRCLQDNTCTLHIYIYIKYTYILIYTYND